MSPSLDVNGFELRNLDPKLRSDLVPRWKRSWISREAVAVSCCDRLAEDGNVSPREAGRAREELAWSPSRALRSPAGWSHGDPKSPSVFVPPIITTVGAH